MKRDSLMVALGLSMLATLSPGMCASAQDFPNLPPLSSADLKMRETPGGAAMILYYAVDTDSLKSTETQSVRIKILNDEGKKQGNVELPYLDKYNQVEDFRARTIGLDGKVTDSSGQVRDLDIVNARKLRYHARVLTLANVEVGSIIEYTYRIHYKEKIPNVFQHPEQYRFSGGLTYPAATWLIQSGLFLKHGQFTLTPLKGVPVGRFVSGSRKGLDLVKLNDGRIRLDVEDIPAYEHEEYAPPEKDLKIRVNLYYAEGFYRYEAYWEGLSSEWGKEYDAFIGKSKAIAAEAARVVAAGDTPEEKLRKLYARAQQVRGLNSENYKTEKEKKQEHLNENKSIEDVLNRGYAYGHDTDLLFIGLARAAGFEAYPIRVTSRQTALFSRDYPNPEQLDALLAAVVINNSFVFLDPEAPFCPYGLLPWSETNTGGVLADQLKGRLLNTPAASSTDAVIRTTAELQLSADGDLKGKVKIIYSGQEALLRREAAIGGDQAKRRDQLEEALKVTLAQGSTVKLISTEGWERTYEPLDAEFEIEIPNYATQAGRRLILPLGVLHASETNPFPSARRVYPIYFEYPFESYEEVRIELPAGVKVEGLPGGQKKEQGELFYELAVKQDGNALLVTRVRRLTGAGATRVEQYPAVRDYFDAVLRGDSLQADLKKTELVEAK